MPGPGQLDEAICWRTRLDTRGGEDGGQTGKHTKPCRTGGGGDLK